MDETDMEIMVGQIKSLLNLCKENNLYDILAESYSCTLIALINNGFSREEAVQIIAHQGAFKLK
jgi:hypothetical protein